jgi:predicted DNA-binding transcriptional regulator AlpA
MTRNYTAGARKLHPDTSAPTEPQRPAQPPLPPGQLSRFKQLQPYLPVSRETWRLLGNAGRAPRPIRLTERCSLWHNDEVNVWLANPAGYVAKV